MPQRDENLNSQPLSAGAPPLLLGCILEVLIESITSHGFPAKPKIKNQALSF